MSVLRKSLKCQDLCLHTFSPQDNVSGTPLVIGVNSGAKRGRVRGGTGGCALVFKCLGIARPAQRVPEREV